MTHNNTTRNIRLNKGIVLFDELINTKYTPIKSYIFIKKQTY